MRFVQGNGFWQNHVPENLIISEYDDAIVRKILDLQITRRRMPGVNPHVLLLFDDMASDQSMRYQETFRRLAMEGRHYFITTIFMTQHYTAASTQVRKIA